MELMAAMVASAFLLTGMGSVMFIARQVAYTPSDATRRSEAADVVRQICDELRYATIVLQQTPQILEFVVTDRNSDGTAERIRYEWSGVAGAPLGKSFNGGAPVNILSAVNAFSIALQQTSKTMTLNSTVDSAETVLQSNATIQSGTNRDISATAFSAQQINPSTFAAVPANAVSWNATKIDFYGRQEGGVSGQVLLVQLRPTGDPVNSPTSNVLGQISVLKSSLTSSESWNTAVFPAPVRDLAFYRQYAVAWAGTGDKSARLRPNDGASSGVLESEDAGASWQFMTTRQMFYRLYGTYTTPGPTYNVTRNYVSSVRIALQTGSQGHSRIDASAPLRNTPELLSTYWRTDFDRNPTTTNANGDSVADWVLTGGGNFDATKLAGGVWTATGAIESRPLADFTTTTTVEARCRNTPSVGGNGAVLRINADRQGGQYAPLLVYVQRQSDGSQILTLNGKTSDAATKQLFSRSKLSSGFIRYKLTILPANNLVNLQINDEDQGTYTYPTYAPAAATDRYLTVYADTSPAEFDYIDARVGTN